MHRSLLIASFVVTACASPLQRAMEDDQKAQSSSGASTASPAAAAMLAAAQMAAAMQAGQARADAVCSPILKHETSFDDERFIGGRLAQSYLKTNPIDAEQTRAVATVGKLLAKKSARPDLPWTFGVVKSDAATATSLPGGYVFVSTALLAKLENEAQLAGVLGHEIAHVAAKDSLNKFRDGKHRQCVSSNTVSSIAEMGIAPGPAQLKIVEFAKKFDGQTPLSEQNDEFVIFLLDTTTQLLQLGNDRDAEFHADRVGLQLASFAGYESAEYEKALTLLGAQGSVMTAHPATEDRVAKLKALREGELAPFATGHAKPALKR